VVERRSEDELRTRLKQQAAVAELGQRALAGLELERLLDEAVRRVTDELGAPYVAVLELQAGGEELLMRAGAGFADGVVGTRRVPATGMSQAAYTLRERQPAISQDLDSEGRFEPSEDLRAGGVRSTATVLIGGRGGSYGVLGVSSRRQHDFADEDVAFIQAIANTLGAAYEQRRVSAGLEREQRQLESALAQVSESEARFHELADDAPVFIWTTDADGLVTFINRGWLEFTGKRFD
jgi:GAF domain-containing protein